MRRHRRRQPGRPEQKYSGKCHLDSMRLIQMSVSDLRAVTHEFFGLRIKRLIIAADVARRYGGGSRNRTYDQRLKRPMLYRLSYTPESGENAGRDHTEPPENDKDSTCLSVPRRPSCLTAAQPGVRQWCPDNPLVRARGRRGLHPSAVIHNYCSQSSAAHRGSCETAETC